MGIAAQHAISNFWLMELYVESLRMVLVLISSVPGYEGIVGISEYCFWIWVCKIESFHIAHKDILCDFLDSGNITAFINTFSRVVSLTGSMSHYFLPSGSVFGPYSSVVVTLNPKRKVSSSFYHFVISFFVIIEFF